VVSEDSSRFDTNSQIWGSSLDNCELMEKVTSGLVSRAVAAVNCSSDTWSSVEAISLQSGEAISSSELTASDNVCAKTSLSKDRVERDQCQGTAQTKN